MHLTTPAHEVQEDPCQLPLASTEGHTPPTLFWLVPDLSSLLSRLVGLNTVHPSCQSP